MHLVLNVLLVILVIAVIALAMPYALVRLVHLLLCRFCVP